MNYEWDDSKAASNLKIHGVSFQDVEGFDWDTALAMKDTRRDYNEKRYVANGLIAGRLHTLVFTIRGDAIRVISLRKSNQREVRHYDSQQ